ncbi:MAG TPA: hypothetical protein PL023_13025 [Thiobacillus sp.]|nr:hypothetical protein [Thiobacillus sp.]
MKLTMLSAFWRNVSVHVWAWIVLFVATTAHAQADPASASATSECIRLEERVNDAERAAAEGGFRGRAELIRLRKDYAARCQPAQPVARQPRPEPEFVPQVGALIDCEKLERDWLAAMQHAENARLPPATPDPAIRKFRQECPDEARAAQERRHHDIDARGPAGFERVRTPGTYGDWLEPLDEQGCRGNNAERDACAEKIIATALAEGRLAQAEVDACRNPFAAASSRNARTAEIQQRRREALPSELRKPERGAWETWRRDTPDCRLESKVSASFTDRSKSPSRMQNRPATPGDRDCGLNVVDPPRCDFADALVKPGYEHWEARAHEQCVRRDPLARSERGYCTRKVIERALAEKQISKSVYEQCRRAAAAGGDTVNICLEARAILDRVGTSKVVSKRTPAAPPRVDLSGYKQSALIRAIQHRDWSNAPFAERAYGVTLFMRLGAACPNLGHADTLPRLIQRWQNAPRETAARLLSGQGTARDLTQLLIDAEQIFGGLENCDRLPAFSSEREQCEQNRAARRNTPASPYGEHDARRWLTKNACASPVTTHFSQRLTEWLFLDDAARGSMSWAANHPRRRELSALFEHCRLQAGDGVADAWCGCYVRQFAAIQQDDTRFRNAAVLAANRASAFVGDGAWFNQFGGGDACSAHTERIAQWRRGQSARPRVTACLVAQTPAPARLTPGTEACRYRTAWGELLFYDTTCRDRLYAHQWGSEPVACQGDPR